MFNKHYKTTSLRRKKKKSINVKPHTSKLTSKNDKYKNKKNKTKKGSFLLLFLFHIYEV